MTHDSSTPPNPWLTTRSISGADYDAPYAERAAAGVNIHGEADLIQVLCPDVACRVLDAGCGTGRVGIELAQRGYTVAGVDLDPEMLAQARRKAPHLAWHLADLATMQLDPQFDVIVAAGNVMIFLTPGSEPAVLANLARHLVIGGLLVAGFRLDADWPTIDLERYDELAAASGLQLVQRWSTWDRAPWSPNAAYAVSVHRRMT